MFAMMKLEQGDQFEQQNADWIRQNLPTYETLWSQFIGNDGTAHPLPLKNLSLADETARARFYQAHYSMAQSAKKLADIFQGLEEVIFFARTNHSVEIQFDFLFNLMSRIGHVRDMVGKMDTALRMGGDAVTPLQEFYDMRSHVCHGPQMPFKLEDEIIHIPRIGRRNPSAVEWDDDKQWDEMAPAEFVPIADFCDELVKALFELLASIHQKIYAAACIKFSGCELGAPLRQSSSIGTETVSFSACNTSGRYWS
jgi:hypothetical protein